MRSTLGSIKGGRCVDCFSCYDLNAKKHLSVVRTFTTDWHLAVFRGKKICALGTAEISVRNLFL